MSDNLAISARTTRLNSLILGRPEALPKEQKEICSGINRDGLLDALFVLYDECNKDAIKKKNKNILDFTNKCELVTRWIFWIFYSISIFSRSSHHSRNEAAACRC